VPALDEKIRKGTTMATNAVAVRDKDARTTIRILQELTEKYRKSDFAVRLWDGTLWGQRERPRFTLVLNHPGALRAMLLSPSELKMGEAFIYGDFDVEGDLESAFELGDFLLTQNLPVSDKLRLGSQLMKLPTRARPTVGYGPVELCGSVHSAGRDRNAVRYHYDLPESFFALWLDRQMVYSCAYFRSAEDDLDTAQTQKLDYICRKLRLRPGDHLLDLGCGWGGLLMHAARHHSVQAFGITLSVPQAELARERIRKAGLADRCKVEVCDYRDLDAPRQYDKIVSVGMFEHVGEAMLPEYFRRAYALLRPGGVFLNHGIAASATFQRQGPSFIDKYVFPDGELVPINTTLRAAEAVGFEARDVESLREHYALTLRHWVRRLKISKDRAREVVDEAAYRVWRLYMAGSAHGFACGRLNLYQLLLSKPELGDSRLPLTREDWYAGA
jgi:cyclopropane-fatty-acyl-phospholipid synthase